MWKIVCQKWKESLEQRFEAFERLRKEDQFCDVTLQSADEVCVKAHKIILITGSGYFNDLFSSGMKETFENLIKYHFKGDVLEKVISFMYTGEMEIASVEKIEEITVCANYLQLDDLIEECMKLLSEFLNDNNCLKYWRLAHECFHQNLENQCISHVLNSPNRIYENESFFNKLDKDEVETLIKDHRLEWIEDTKLEKLLQWTKQKTKISEEFFEIFLKLIEFINFAAISKGMLLVILRDKHLTEHQNILEIISVKCEEKPHLSPTALPSKTRLLAFIGDDFISVSDEGEFTILETSKNSLRCAACTTFNNFLFICGGTNDKFQCFNACEYFDPQNIERHNLPPVMISRFGHACSFLEDKIYACGGTTNKDYLEKLNLNNTHLTSVEIFDINKQKWTQCQNMKSRRRFFGLTPVNRSLYAVGGLGAKTIEMFEPRSGDGWTEVYNKIEKDIISECVSLDSGEIYCFFNDFFAPSVFDTKMNKMREWEGATKYIKPPPQYLFRTCESNGHLNFIQCNTEDSKFINFYKYDVKGTWVFPKLKAFTANKITLNALVSLSY